MTRGSTAAQPAIPVGRGLEAQRDTLIIKGFESVRKVKNSEAHVFAGGPRGKCGHTPCVPCGRPLTARCLPRICSAASSTTSSRRSSWRRAHTRTATSSPSLTSLGPCSRFFPQELLKKKDSAIDQEDVLPRDGDPEGGPVL